MDANDLLKQYREKCFQQANVIEQNADRIFELKTKLADLKINYLELSERADVLLAHCSTHSENQLDVALRFRQLIAEIGKSIHAITV